jgi:hypothetical protein
MEILLVLAARRAHDSSRMSVHKTRWKGHASTAELRQNKAGMDFRADDDYDSSEPLVEICSMDFLCGSCTGWIGDGRSV